MVARLASRRGPVPGYGTMGAMPTSQRERHTVDDYVDEVLSAVEGIPPGRVLTYGDVAALVRRGGPRQVGQVMARYGGAVPWWRVVRADGRLLAGSERRALEHYRVEGTPLRQYGDTPRLDLRRARWDGQAAE